MKENYNTTILFVDDEESILEIAEEYFNFKGYNVITANDGTEAVKVLDNNKVDLCFTDINMPKMNGIELTQHIRENFKNIPVIVMTGFPSLDNSIKILKNGVVDFLIKPVNLEQMEFCIQRVLREHELYVENILLTREVEEKKRIEALNRELTQKVNELNDLNKIMTGFSSIHTSSELFNSAVVMSNDILKADGSGFYFYNEGMDFPHKIVEIFKNESGVNTKQLKRMIADTVMDKTPFYLRNTSVLNENVINISNIKSLIIVPLDIRGKAFGAISAFSNTKEFSERDLYYLSYLSRNAAKTIENIALYENIYENLFATLSAFVAAVEARDSYTFRHSKRVANLAVEIAKKMNCTEREISVLEVAGNLHDIGKIGIRDEILLKPSRLNLDEFEKIKTHAEIGSNIVSQLGLWNEEGKVIKYHHERYDGKGYPHGLKSNEIPLLARILTVADSFDAMASNRPYRSCLDYERVVANLKRNSGTQFDPEIVESFLKIDKNKINEIINMKL